MASDDVTNSEPATKTATVATQPTAEPEPVYTFIGPSYSTITLEEGGKVYRPGDVLPISREVAISLAGEGALQIAGPDLPKQEGLGESARGEELVRQMVREQSKPKP